MLAYAIDNPAPSVLVLISGDRDFAYALSTLRFRQYQIILVTLSNAHPSLTSQASACVDWHSEIINPVVQSPSRMTNNVASSAAGTPLYRDSMPGQSSPSQSSQSMQGAENAHHADHGDLLHYLRASTSARPRRTSDASFNIGNGQQARYERPRQDVSPPIEVELTNVRPSLVSKPATDFMRTSASNGSSPSAHAILDSVEDPSSTLAYGTKDAMVDPNDARTSFFSLSANPGQPFSTSLPKIASPAPTLLPSLMQETPQHSPAAQYADLETDIPADDSTDLRFTYPVRPSSAPHSLPSQSSLGPFISVSDPLASEISTMLSGSPNAEALPIPLDSSASQQHILISQETPGKSISPVVKSTSLPDTMSEETYNNPDLDPPDINPTNQQSPSFTSSNGVNHPYAIAVVNQATSITGSQNPIDRLPPITPIKSCKNLPGTSISNVQNTVDKPSPIIPSAAASSSKPVPPIFKILVDTLKTDKSKDNPRFLSAWVAETIHKNGFTYENTGVSMFSQYIALAEKQGIVELGTHQNEAWICLKPEYRDPPPAPVVPPIFKVLVEALKVNRSNGILRPSRSNIAIAISRNGLTYKEAGVKKFGQYASLAEQWGIVDLGGRDGDVWISLKPEYQDASTT
ncbi:hypothetical protein BJ912DRAFT_503746 [Pholiota molesta]|nr:hypothetical protein BJ912DRAFT_503746 [Pholiota molesta]